MRMCGGTQVGGQRPRGCVRVEELSIADYDYAGPGIMSGRLQRALRLQGCPWAAASAGAVAVKGGRWILIRRRTRTQVFLVDVSGRCRFRAAAAGEGGVEAAGRAAGAGGPGWRWWCMRGGRRVLASTACGDKRPVLEAIEKLRRRVDGWGAGIGLYDIAGKNFIAGGVNRCCC